MARSEVWACDAPGCLVRSATNPIPLWIPTGHVPWRNVLGMLICPAHKVSILVDGLSLVDR